MKDNEKNPLSLVPPTYITISSSDFDESKPHQCEYELCRDVAMNAIWDRGRISYYCEIHFDRLTMWGDKGDLCPVCKTTIL